MSPTTSRGKSGRKYRYDVWASLQQGGKASDDRIRRIAAPEIERVVSEALARWLPRQDERWEHLGSVQLREDGLLVALSNIEPAHVATNLSGEESLLHQAESAVTILLPIALPMRGGRKFLVAGGKPSARPDPVLIAAPRKAHAMLGSERGQPVMQIAPASPYDRMILRLALLAPDIQRRIMRGHQPAGFNLEALKEIDVPLDWKKQREALGWEQGNTPCYGE